MQKKTAQKTALFRFSIISAVLHEDKGGQNSYFRKMAQKEFEVPHKAYKKKYSVSTMKSWLRKYREGGIEALYPATRSDSGTFKKIPESVEKKVKEVIENLPFLSVAGIHRKLRHEGKIQPLDFTEVTLRNFIKKKNLRKKDEEKIGRKKYETPGVNILWVTDFMHGPCIKDSTQKNRKRKTYLCAIIDDHSRLIVGAEFFFEENSLALARVLKEALLQYGLPKKLYCDNGSVFSTAYLNLACARTQIALIHSKPYDSPSRGKIERFFRTVRSQFLADVKLENIYSLYEFNEVFHIWLDDLYHQTVHGTTKQTPKQRYLLSMPHQKIRRISEHELNQAFYNSLERQVKNDATVSINNKLYEVPAQYIGTKIEIRHPLDNPRELTLFAEGKPVILLNPVNVIENADKPHTAIHFNQKGEKI